MTNYSTAFDIDAGFMGTIVIEVKYAYTPADNGGREHPSSDEEFDILSVKAEGMMLGEKVSIDISALGGDVFTQNIIKELKENQ